MKRFLRAAALLLILALLGSLAPTVLASEPEPASVLTPLLTRYLETMSEDAAVQVWVYRRNLSDAQREQLLEARYGSAEPTREQLLQVVRDYYTADNRAFLQARLPELEQSAVVYCSRYAPILVLELTKAQILGLSELEEVTLIDRFFSYDLIPEEPVPPQPEPTPTPEPTSPAPTPTTTPTPWAPSPSGTPTSVGVQVLPGPTSLEIREAYRLFYDMDTDLVNIRVLGYFGRSERGYELVTVIDMRRIKDPVISASSLILLGGHLFYFYTYTEQIPVLAYQDGCFTPIEEAFAAGALTQKDVDSVFDQMYPRGPYRADTFADIGEGKWYDESVANAYAAGITSGVSRTRFDPQGSLTRGMFVTLLSRVDAPDNQILSPTASHPKAAVIQARPAFSDVPDKAYYHDPALWAAAVGVTQGVSADRFAPDTPITREQAVTMLRRYVSALGIELAETGTDQPYEDSARISAYAAEAVAWARKVGLMNGDEQNCFRPKKQITRAEAAKIMWLLYAALYEGRFTAANQSSARMPLRP